MILDCNSELAQNMRIIQQKGDNHIAAQAHAMLTPIEVWIRSEDDCYTTLG